MNCPKCGNQNDDNAKFCRSCYTRFTDNKIQSAPRRSMKGLPLVVMFGFVVVALGVLYLVIGLDPMWRMLDKEIVREYNRRLTETNAVLQEHDRLVKSFSETAAKRDPVASASFAKEYSEKTERWVSSLNEFKLFIETNDKRIRRVGTNPDYIRDNIKSTLATTKENEARFYREADQLGKEAVQADQLKLKPAREAIAALQKLEASFLVGISYRDYTPALGETLHQVRGFLESPGAATKPELAESLRKVLLHYAMVKEVWDDELTKQANRSPELMDRIRSLYPEVRKYRKKYTYTSPYTHTTDTWYSTDYDDIRRVILKNASEELEKAKGLLPQ